MALRDAFDWRSAVYAIIALAGTGTLALGSPPLVEAFAFALIAVVAAVGVPVAGREAVPEYDRVFAVCLGAIGVAQLAAEGLAILPVLFALIGVSSVVAMVYERYTGRSTRLA
ncbi:hypothetical protein [Halocalculus aciditolerans]|uniref:Uncharacterized protein n=1 Tax=Halocalculus aciditolerans TaxID=1383812 RepID=A0A830FFD6_9EURY|nr:hypothetical protein [Halocalculus aciditolerans]GGL49921.1 hypothetical protein GCM10009039_05070 [Halocalculus aciditolerans]